MRSYPTLFAALTALAAACSQGVESPLAPSGAALVPLTHPVTVEVDRSRYATGDLYEIHITNHGTVALGYSTCPGRWGRTIGDELPTEMSEELMSCAAAFTPLPPGTTVRETHEFPLGMQSGYYSRFIRIHDASQDRVEDAGTTFFYFDAR
jgi:hypothetical protein